MFSESRQCQKPDCSTTLMIHVPILVSNLPEPPCPQLSEVKRALLQDKVGSRSQVMGNRLM